MSDKWMVKVFESEKHAYDESFRTRKAAVEFVDKVTSSQVKWSCELVELNKRQRCAMCGTVVRSKVQLAVYWGYEDQTLCVKCEKLRAVSR